MKKKYKVLEKNWGKPKDDYFESNQIGEYFEFNEDSNQSYSLSGEVCHELDLKVFFNLLIGRLQLSNSNIYMISEKCELYI